MNTTKKIKIEDKYIGEGFPCFIIAEVGVNHNGNIILAKKLIDIAKKVGADAVKFQTFKTENLVTRRAPKAKYQLTKKAETQFDMLKKLELTEDEFKQLFDYCRLKKIIFLSTPLDMASAHFLFKLGIAACKIGSGDITDFSLLSQVAKYKKPMILSTGMSTLKEVKEAVNLIRQEDNDSLILLHCTSNYPTQFEDVNLKAMLTLKKTFKLPVGCSDHTLGIEVAAAAVALGAKVFEKHLTLSRNLSGPDHKISLEPTEFKKLIQNIRNIEKALGNGLKTPQKSEYEIRKIARKSIVAAVPIKKGTTLVNKMLTCKRPGTGIEPKQLEKVTGKITKVSLEKDEIIKWSQLK